MNQEDARKILIEHSRSNKNGVFPDKSDYQAAITNPVCGDHVELKVKCLNGKIIQLGFKAVGCAICNASASLLCVHLEGQLIEEGILLSDLFQKAIMEPKLSPWPEELRQFLCFEHLRINPARKTCALLPWLTFKKAMK